MYNRAINFNNLKKSDNQELIRKSLQNFERSFKEILEDKIASKDTASDSKEQSKFI
jgi:hypothetical protein